MGGIVEQRAKVVAFAWIAKGIFRLDLRIPYIARQIQPGQFVLLEGIFLGRPLTVYSTDDKQVIRLVCQVVGDNTRQYAELRPGDSISVRGPLGQAAIIDPEVELFILVGGGVGLASLHFLGRYICQQTEARVIVVAGFKTKDHVFGIDDLRKLGAEMNIVTDEKSRHERGTAVDAFQRIISRPDGLPDCQRIQVYSCGPSRMMEGVASLVQQAGIPCFVFLETVTICGFGVCLGCTITTTDGFKLLCQDGPIFPAAKVDWSSYTAHH